MMSASRTNNLTAHPTARRPIAPPPNWARALVDHVTPTVHASNVATISISTGRNATLASATCHNVAKREADAFHHSTATAFRAVRRAVDSSPHRHVVRMWNWIPNIHAEVDADRDRYMVFNAARFEAMTEWFGGGADAIAGRVPAASGVGHDGGSLVVQALAMAGPGEAIENPRQVPAYRYSRKYGPLPPCFARATRIAVPHDALLVAGTAAITGEQSYHTGDLDAQFSLTLENLRAVLAAGGAKAPGGDVLHAMRHVRVYVAREAERAEMERLARAAFSPDADLEFVPADLCRPELLVEIEGTAWDETPGTHQP